MNARHAIHNGINDEKLYMLSKGLSHNLSGESFTLPWWLIMVFVVSNVTLSTLNVVWFGKMIRKLLYRYKKTTAKVDKKP